MAINPMVKFSVGITLALTIVMLSSAPKTPDANADRINGLMGVLTPWSLIMAYCWWPQKRTY